MKRSNRQPLCQASATTKGGDSKGGKAMRDGSAAVLGYLSAVALGAILSSAPPAYSCDGATWVGA